MVAGNDASPALPQPLGHIHKLIEEAHVETGIDPFKDFSPIVRTAKL